MGCDIHPHFEIKLGGVWYHYSSPRIERNYALFAMLADVRNSFGVTPIAPQRGLPADCSAVTRMCADYDGEDGHSHSWLTMPEFREAALTLEKKAAEKGGHWYSWSHDKLGYLCGNDIYEWTPGSDSYAAEIEDVRFVFWFDN